MVRHGTWFSLFVFGGLGCNCCNCRRYNHWSDSHCANKPHGSHQKFGIAVKIIYILVHGLMAVSESDIIFWRWMTYFWLQIVIETASNTRHSFFQRCAECPITQEHLALISLPEALRRMVSSTSRLTVNTSWDFRLVCCCFVDSPSDWKRMQVLERHMKAMWRHNSLRVLGIRGPRERRAFFLARPGFFSAAQGDAFKVYCDMNAGGRPSTQRQPRSQGPFLTRQKALGTKLAHLHRTGHSYGCLPQMGAHIYVQGTERNNNETTNKNILPVLKT